MPFPVNTGGAWSDQEAALLVSEEFQPNQGVFEAAGESCSLEDVVTGPILTALGCCRLREQVGDKP